MFIKKYKFVQKIWKLTNSIDILLCKNNSIKGWINLRVGIDLGTTNSAVAYMNENNKPEIIPNSEGERTTPSVILIQGEKAIVGEVAKEASTYEVENIIQFVKRQMGNTSFRFPLPDSDRMIDAIEASAIILKKIVQDAEQALGEEVTDAVITVPAYFDDAKRIATKEAAEMIGLNVLKIINEPTAATLAYYHLDQTEDEQIVAVYDLGGGTFDISIVQIENNEVKVLSTDGDSSLGGFDFDNIIFNYVADQFEEETDLDIYDDEMAMQQLREDAERCKRSLSRLERMRISVTSQGQSIQTEVTKDLFNELIESYLSRTIQIMEEAIEEASLEWSHIDKILLVGGSTRIPRITEVIEQLTGIKPSDELNPDEIVALGAAVQASVIDKTETSTQSLDEIVVRDVNSHSLGVISTDNSGIDRNSIILPRNSEIPCTSAERFVTARENQSAVHIQVTEGEDDDPNYVTIIGSSTIDLPENLPLESPIEIRVSYDENGIVNISAFDLYNNHDLGNFDIERKSNMTKQGQDENQSSTLSMEVE